MILSHPASFSVISFNVECSYKVASAGQMLYLLDNPDGPIPGIRFYRIKAARTCKIILNLSCQTSAIYAHQFKFLILFLFTYKPTAILSSML